MTGAVRRRNWDRIPIEHLLFWRLSPLRKTGRCGFYVIADADRLG